MKMIAAFGRVISFLLGLCLIVAVILGFFRSPIVRDSILVLLAFSAIFYFEWVLGEMSKKIETLEELCREIQKNSNELAVLRVDIDEVVRFVRAEEAERELVELDAKLRGEVKP